LFDRIGLIDLIDLTGLIGSPYASGEYKRMTRSQGESCDRQRRGDDRRPHCEADDRTQREGDDELVLLSFLFLLEGLFPAKHWTPVI
jgi:hypothetical protein